MDLCACDVHSSEALPKINLIEVCSGIYMGPFQSGFKTKELIDLGVTHILNVTNKAYTKRTKYFKYLDIAIYDAPSEDSRRHYRITNRFIHEALKEGKILVHSFDGKSRAPTFILAYLIYQEKLKLKDGLTLLRQFVAEVEPNEGFMQ
mmetsp:Transcript_29846/g.21600  ORF Transcript_29846/g.21600 Transcript_29846/m.21600 type:complete len:148 (-) Transcript_29846:131-574(-)